jgi:hypothetical protein
MNASTTTPQGFDYELRFQSVFNAGCGYAFPCDASGRVDMDSLSERSRNNYLFARAVVGIELARPDVLPCAAH